ncbi:MAG: hypothetical protein K2N94_07425, partial [Lachnospiraceae bacterium]|nr:hypothetical protein [Lachnospiraceae bacterium]
MKKSIRSAMSVLLAAALFCSGCSGQASDGNSGDAGQTANGGNTGDVGQTANGGNAGDVGQTPNGGNSGDAGQAANEGNNGSTGQTAQDGNAGSTKNGDQSEESALSEAEKKLREQQAAVLERIGRKEDFHIDEFGNNVYIFSPADDPEKVQQILTRLWNAQEKNQFGEARYGLYFLPGEYDESISVKVGYYMQVSGLGYLPDDTQVKSLNCDARWLGGNDNHNATCNFWRGVENLRVNSTVMWAVSQATFMRRVHITG